MALNSTVQKLARTASRHAAIQLLTDFPAGVFDACSRSINQSSYREGIPVGCSYWSDQRLSRGDCSESRGRYAAFLNQGYATEQSGCASRSAYLISPPISSETVLTDSQKWRLTRSMRYRTVTYNA